MAKKPADEKAKWEKLKDLWNEKEINQGIMLAFLGNDKAKTLLDDLPDDYSCEFIISPPDEKYSDYIRINNYKKKMQIAFIGVPSDTEECEVIIRPVLKNINRLKLGEKLVVIAMLNWLSSDLDVVVEGEIKI